MAKGENVTGNPTLNVRFEEPHAVRHDRNFPTILITKRRKKPRQGELKQGQGHFNPCYIFRWLCNGSCTLRTGCIVGACIQIVIGVIRFCIFCWMLASLTGIFTEMDKVAGEKHEQIIAVNEAIIDRNNASGKRNATYKQAPNAYVVSDEVIIQQRNATVEGTTWHAQEVLILLLVYDVLFISLGLLGLAGFFLIHKWMVLGYTLSMVALVIFRILRHMYTVQTLYEMMVLMRAYREVDPLFAEVDDYLSEPWVRQVPLKEYLCALFGWLWILILNSAALFNQIQRGEYRGLERSIFEMCRGRRDDHQNDLKDTAKSSTESNKDMEPAEVETEAAILEEPTTNKWWNFGLFG